MLRRSTRKRSASTMRGKQASTVPTNPSAVAPLSASTSQRSTGLSTYHSIVDPVTNLGVPIAGSSGVTTTPPSPLLGNSLDSSHKTCMPTEFIKASDNISRNVSQNLKQKIISGEYIDLANLVCNVQNGSSDNQTISLVQGQLIVQPKQQDIKTNNNEAWTEAWTEALPRGL